MTEPTDAELDSIDMDAKAIANQNPIGTPFAWRKAYLTALARAVLQRWGQPARAAEPLFPFRHGCKWCGKTPVCEHTPQPIQTQPVARGPLTQAKVVEAFCALPHQVQFITAFDQGVRFAERHHGIKGGQHGADT